MPSAVIWFATNEFSDTEADRDNRINEHIGGAELARWLSAALRQLKLDASAPWAEDHGWDFDVRDASSVYQIVCTIEDVDGKPREACVQVHKSGPAKQALDRSDPILAAVIAQIEGRGAAITVD